ncbi:MAG: ribosome hibernation-promoting factor, HPF/YfiA family [Elusimicrobiota bacterium]
MKINVTARHTELTPALTKYAKKRLRQVKKYVDKITKAHVILNIEKDRHIAEVILGLSKNNITAKAVAGDMYGAIDMVMDKITKQLRRHMDKVKDHKHIPPYSAVAEMVREEAGASKEGQENQKLELQEVKESKLKEQTINEALETLQKERLDFWAFRETRKNTLNIVYKRPDGTYGMQIIK